jgi:hypothetical protein
LVVVMCLGGVLSWLLSFDVLQWWSSCLYQALFYLNTKRARHDLEKKLISYKLNILEVVFI